MADPPPSDARASAETQLRRAARLAALVENTPLAVIEWNHEQRVTRWNARAEQVFGWSAAEVLGRTIRDWRFVHEDDLPAVERLVGAMCAGQVPGTVSSNRNYTKAGGVV